MNANDNTSALRKLSALVDFSNLINSSLDINFSLNNLILSCFGKFHTSRAIIFLIDDNGNLIARASKGIDKRKLTLVPKCEVKDYEVNPDLKKFITENKLVVKQEIKSSDGFIGILYLGEKIMNGAYDDDDLDFLKTLVNIAAISIENSLIIEKLQLVNRKLDSKVNQLSSLFDLSKEFGGTIEESQVSKLLMFSLIGQLLVSRFAIISIQDGKAKILESKIDTEEFQKIIEDVELLKIDKPLTDENIEDLFPELHKLGIKLIVPMAVQGKILGMIFLGKRNTGQKYSEADIEFVSSVGSIAVISIENARLFQETLEKQKLEKDLELARNIQKNLLPKKFPATKHFSIAAINETARQVGGDYYDIVKLDEHRTLIAIGDVSGKGVQAALLMANVQAFLKSICKQNIPLDEASNLINDLVSENTSGGSFITFFWGILDDRNLELSYVNAGHNPPLLYSSDEEKKLKTGGMILGVMETLVPYIAETVQLKKGDALVLFTDGITEAWDSSNQDYTDERLEKLCFENKDKSAEEIINLIRDDVKNHTKGAEQSDDITALVVKVN